MKVMVKLGQPLCYRAMFPSMIMYNAIVSV
jgi:hypothetical protein